MTDSAALNFPGPGVGEGAGVSGIVLPQAPGMPAAKDSEIASSEPGAASDSPPIAMHSERSQFTPFYFTSRSQPIFSWLHTPLTGATLDHGIVLCPPIGHELLHAHRAMRHLAEALAAARFPVLRFDWFGTGDSAGGDNDLDHLAHWQANVHDAVRWMKDSLKVTRVSVVGLRMGGLLAAHELRGEAVDSLVLWAPISNGRRFVRELQLISAAAADAPHGAREVAAGMDAAGYWLSPETVTGICAMDMARLPVNCRRALLAFRDDLPADQNTVKLFSAAGIATETVTLPGVKAMLAEPHFTQVPHEAIDAIVDWFANDTMQANELPAADVPALLMTQAATMLHTERPITEHQEPAHILERVWKLQRPEAMFGVVCEPASTPAPELPLVVLLNSGSSYRVGASRLNVLLARRLASLGFRSLRLDARGLGDSPASRPEMENDTYPNAGLADLAAVLAAAERDFGHQRCVLIGLCAGAYYAFQAAAQFREPGLAESLLINPLAFDWRDNATQFDEDVLAELGRYSQLAREVTAGRLWKFISGRSDVGYAGAARVALTQSARALSRCWTMATRRCKAAAATADAPADDATRGYGHPAWRDVSGDLQRVAKSGRKLTLYLASGDPGLTILNCQAPRETGRLRRQGILHVVRIPDSDHTFTRHEPRNALLDAIAKHLIDRYPISPPGSSE